MRISSKVRYGLKALTYIVDHGKNGHFVRIKEISEAQDTSSQYLEQILYKLKNEGIIEGKRGPYGGYIMKKSPAEISLHKIYTILNEEEKIINCNEDEIKKINCREGNCSESCIWGKMDNAMSEILKNTTLEDFVKGNKGNIGEILD